MASVPVWILLTTFQRTRTAVRTIEAIHKHLNYPDLRWFISDDGSPQEHLRAVEDAIGQGKDVRWYNSRRRGVGHGMNKGLRTIFGEGGSLVLVLEDDWELTGPLDLEPYASLLETHSDTGMIRLGYLSPGLKGELVSLENRLFWKFEQSDYQYTFSGHASLRHRRFFDQVGYYIEGLAPGWTELDMCAKYNACLIPPAILWPAAYGQWGPFAHIGSESLADVAPASE